MTAGDFIPDSAPELEEASPYPVIFGIQITPIVGGIVIALFGIAAAFWVYQTFIAPIAEQNAQLQAEVNDKESLLIDTGELERQIQEAQARLDEAEALRADVRGLFATEEGLDTLLLDVNERVRSANTGIETEEGQASLTNFQLNDEASGVISDSSFGPEVNNCLARRVFDVSLQGDFAQTQSIIRNIERLQPLLVLQNFDSTLNSDAQVSLINETGQIVNNNGYFVIDTSFQLSVLLPSPETCEQANAPPPEEGEEGAAPEGGE
jgi:type IV pilus assembly protein PilO